MLIRILSLVAVLFSSLAHAELKLGWFDQKLDPTQASDQRTFRQRYAIDSQYARGMDSPVIYFLGNEGDFMSLLGTAGYINVLAKELGAHLVSLEHRYYGQSIPFEQLTGETMKYLTMENALSDFNSFENYAVKELGLKGKWVAIGRSYGGSLAAYYREKYPEQVVGAIAAAPALFFPKEVKDGDEAVARAIGPECVRSFHEKILAPIEQVFQAHGDLASFKAPYDASDIMADDDFLNFLGFAATTIEQMTGPSYLCPALASAAPQQAFIDLVQRLRKEMGLGRPVELVDQGMKETKSSAYSGGVGLRQWVYQTCTQFGMFSPVPKDPTQTLQSTMLADFYTFDGECMKVLGIHGTADNDALNAKYFAPLMGPESRVSNLLVTNDEKDPVQVLSIRPEQNTNPKITVFVVQGAAHHEELNLPKPTDPASFNEARALMLNSVRTWVGGGLR